MPVLIRKMLFSLFITLASLYPLNAANAQGGQPYTPTDDDVNRVAKNLYCPVCPNTPLDVCETKACEDWRAQIRDQLAQGWTDQQIIDYFVAQYGERVLAEPQRKGFTSFVWILPVIAVLIGLAIVYEVLRGWRSPRGSPRSSSPPARIEPEILDKIEQELNDLD